MNVEAIEVIKVIEDLVDRLDGAREVIEGLAEYYDFSVEDVGFSDALSNARECINKLR